MSFPARPQVNQTVYKCAHYDVPVLIENKVVYPSDIFAEMPQRLLNRTCSHEFDCYLLDKSACPMHLRQIRNQMLQ
jgi:hypothetical protein